MNKKDFQLLSNIFKEDQKIKHYRNFKDIQFIWNGEWSDPILIYKNISFNYWDIEDYLYNEFQCDLNDGYTNKYSNEENTDNEFDQWCKDNIERCYMFIEEIINERNYEKEYYNCLIKQYIKDFDFKLYEEDKCYKLEDLQQEDNYYYFETEQKAITYFAINILLPHFIIKSDYAKLDQEEKDLFNYIKTL